jgi:hypothetical protein
MALVAGPCYPAHSRVETSGQPAESCVQVLRRRRWGHAGTDAKFVAGGDVDLRGLNRVSPGLERTHEPAVTRFPPWIHAWQLPRSRPLNCGIAASQLGFHRAFAGVKMVAKDNSLAPLLKSFPLRAGRLPRKTQAARRRPSRARGSRR